CKVEYRHEIVHYIEREPALEKRLDDEPAAGSEHQRVAIRRGADEEVDRQIARRAGLVVDEHALGKPLRQTLGRHAAEEIGHAAGRSVDDEADAAAGVLILRVRQAKQEAQRSREAPHGSALLDLVEKLLRDSLAQLL